MFTHGKPSKFSTTGGSGKPHDNYFCKKCGSAIYSVYHAAPPQFCFIRIIG
ncbi:GFA family protein [Marinicella rhabdoformis]|uniref:GFA family protein n=1 Tax=Marinicella rhabdoformis TaxID=2580566 RepID=UPI003CCE3D83